MFFANCTLLSMLKTNPGQFWGFINKNDISTITLKTPDGDAIANVDCASALNEVFIQSFACSTSTAYPCFETCHFLPMESFVTDVDGIVNIINSLKRFSSSGIDGIDAKL